MQALSDELKEDRKKLYDDKYQYRCSVDSGATNFTQLEITGIKGDKVYLKYIGLRCRPCGKMIRGVIYSCPECKRGAAYSLTGPEMKELLDAQPECPLCGDHLDLRHAVVDHDHRWQKKATATDPAPKESVRGLLCRDCNLSIGRIETMNAYDPDKTIAFLRNLISYLEVNPARSVLYTEDETPNTE